MLNGLITGDAMNTLYTTLIIASAALAVNPEPIEKITNVPFVQYGALGLCGFMVYFLCKHISKMHADHKAERKTLMDQVLNISIKAVEIQSTLVNEIRNKPCILEGDVYQKTLEDIRESVEEIKHSTDN